MADKLLPEIKFITTRIFELPWEGYSKSPPLFTREAIALVVGHMAVGDVPLKHLEDWLKAEIKKIKKEFRGLKDAGKSD